MYIIICIYSTLFSRRKTDFYSSKKMRKFEVDVPVRVMLWTRPDCLRQQFEVLRQAAPSVLFLVSDGGRNEKEKNLIAESRKIFDDIDWECTVYKLYFEENQGMYTMQKHMQEFIWDKVDRCVFLEDDYVPAVSFFKFCAELLEKYKDDERIYSISGHNPFVTYPDAEPNDYFFTENGWSVWGNATWKRVMEMREYPLSYTEDEYVKKCLKANLSKFWYKKVEGYCNGKLVDNHVPGGEYFHATNSVLHHMLTITPTRNMIKNIGFQGAHFNMKKGKKLPIFMNAQTYEIDFPIKHPKYVIDDKNYTKKYVKLIGHKVNPFKKFFTKLYRLIKAIVTFKIFGKILKKIRSRREIER